MNFTVKPLHDFVLIRVLSENKTSGGIHLPDGSKVDKGIMVEDVGSDCKSVKKGDFIIFGGTTISTIKDENGNTTEFALIPEKNIYGIKKFNKK